MGQRNRFLFTIKTLNCITLNWSLNCIIFVITITYVYSHPPAIQLESFIHSAAHSHVHIKTI